MAFTQDLTPRLHYIITPVSLSGEVNARGVNIGEANIGEANTGEANTGEVREANIGDIKNALDLESRAHRRVVFIHGLFLGNLAGWHPMITSLVSDHATSLCYDLRGHGLSERPSRGYSVSDHVADLLALLDALAWRHEPLTLVGHSFGGRIALELALRALNITSSQSRLQVERVMLIDTPIAEEDDDAIFRALRAPGAPDEESGAALERLLSPEINQTLLSGGRRARKLMHRWRALLEDTTLTRDLDHDTPPTRATLSELSAKVELWGLYGGRSGAQASRQLLSEITPTRRQKVLSERGHFLLNEAPAEVGAWVAAALNQPTLNQPTLNQPTLNSARASEV